MVSSSTTTKYQVHKEFFLDQNLRKIFKYTQILLEIKQYSFFLIIVSCPVLSLPALEYRANPTLTHHLNPKQDGR